MIDGSEKVWLTGFYFYRPEDDGSYGFTREEEHSWLLERIGARQLVCVFGHEGPPTPEEDRGVVLGVMEVERALIDSHDKMSPALAARYDAEGWGREWRLATPVRRAWRAAERIDAERLFGRGARLTREENFYEVGAFLSDGIARRLLSEVAFVEVDVFGEPPAARTSRPQPLAPRAAQTPSEPFPPSRSTRASSVVRQPDKLYLATVREGGELLAGRSLAPGEQVWKIGISGDPDARRNQLNLGFPDTSRIRWSIQRVADLDGLGRALQAEQRFKDRAVVEVPGSSLGHEFFVLTPAQAATIFGTAAGT